MMKDLQRYRILLIEDDTDDMQIAYEYLHDRISAPDITHVTTFNEAASLLSGGNRDFDIILLDLTLPDMHGRELIAEMLDTVKCAVPIIVLTGYADTAFGITTISQCIFDYLVKTELTPSILYKSIVYSLERQKTISDLRKSEWQYSSLFNLSPQPMWLYDTETFTFKKVNKAAIETYGYTKQEFLRMGLADIKARTDAPETINCNIRKRHARGLYNGRYLHRKKNGEIIHADVSCTPIIIEGLQYILVVAIDRTESTLLEHAVTRAIIKTQEDERYDIGAELHDNVCQILATTLMTLDIQKKSMPEESPYLLQSKEYIKLALNEIRSLSHRLAPAFFENTNLETALVQLFRSNNVDNRYALSLHVDPVIHLFPLGDDMQLNLYRIVQEQLRNIQKHAAASAINIALTVNEETLTLSINDNGIGFHPETLKAGIGFANIKRRAELFFGRMEVSTQKEKGCTLTIAIPLKMQEKHVRRNGVKVGS